MERQMQAMYDAASYVGCVSRCRMWTQDNWGGLQRAHAIELGLDGQRIRTKINDWACRGCILCRRIATSYSRAGVYHSAASIDEDCTRDAERCVVGETKWKELEGTTVKSAGTIEGAEKNLEHFCLTEMESFVIKALNVEQV